MRVKERLHDDFCGRRTFRIGFVNSEGKLDATELDANSPDDLETLFEGFCKENNFSCNTVQYVTEVEDDRPEEALTTEIIAELLEEHNIPDLKCLLRTCKRGEHLNLINLNYYFSAKLFCDEDIISVLEEEGYDGCDSNVKMVLAAGSFDSLMDCTDDDWNTIRYAINKVSERLIPATD